VIDKDGFRHGVGIILVNDNRQVFFAKRVGRDAWQFPQGGLITDESPEQAMFRELKEEVGLDPQHVSILAETKRWMQYRLPHRLIRHYSHPLCIGQRQKWFLLRFVGSEENINLYHTSTPEFDSWAWVSYWYPLSRVVNFKRRVYSLVMKEFSRLVLPKRFVQSKSE
jgi:putative (di)nucleoside polyphosphate hydrolase